MPQSIRGWIATEGEKGGEDERVDEGEVRKQDENMTRGAHKKSNPTLLHRVATRRKKKSSS